MNRHLSRIITMQSLYEWDFRHKDNPVDITKRNIKHSGDSADQEFILDIVQGVVKDIAEIDGLIVKAAPEWPLEQISVVDKTILRLAIYELLYCDEVPPKVAINEAVELGKTFGGENSSKFINGVLGTLFRQSSKYSEEDEVINSEVRSKEVEDKKVIQVIHDVEAEEVKPDSPDDLQPESNIEHPAEDLDLQNKTKDSAEE